MRPVSSVLPIAVLKTMSPDFMQICAVCAQKVMVAPPILIDFYAEAKAVLTF